MGTIHHGNNVASYSLDNNSYLKNKACPRANVAKKMAEKNRRNNSLRERTNFTYNCRYIHTHTHPHTRPHHPHTRRDSLNCESMCLNLLTAASCSWGFTLYSALQSMSRAVSYSREWCIHGSILNYVIDDWPILWSTTCSRGIKPLEWYDPDEQNQLDYNYSIHVKLLAWKHQKHRHKQAWRWGS